MNLDNVTIRTRAIAEFAPGPMLDLLIPGNMSVCTFTRTQGMLPMRITQRLMAALDGTQQEFMQVLGITSSSERAADAREFCSETLGHASSPITIRTSKVSAFVKHVWTSPMKKTLFSTVYAAPRLHNRPRKTLTAKLLASIGGYASITAKGGRVVLLLLAPYNRSSGIESWDTYWSELRHVSRAAFEAFHCSEICVDATLLPVPEVVGKHIRLPEDPEHCRAFMSYLLVHARMSY